MDDLNNVFGWVPFENAPNVGLTTVANGNPALRSSTGTTITLTPDHVLIDDSATAPEEKDDGLVRRAFSFHVPKNSINEEERTCDFIFSSEALDSYDEIVKQDWSKRLNRYKNNPTILYAHNGAAFFDKAEDSLPIGRCVKLEVKDGKLQGTVKFGTSAYNEMAERIWQGVREGMITATSVGFRPHTVSREKLNDRDYIVLSDNELYEISIVPMGANYEAVRRSVLRQTQRQRLLELASNNSYETTTGDGDIMTPDEIRKLQESKAAADARIQALEDEAKEAREKAAKAEQDATEARERAAKAEEQQAEINSKAIADRARSLVGKKIVPAQVESFINLMCGDASDDFSKFVELIPDLNLTDKTIDEPLVTTAPKARASKLAERAKAAYNKELGQAE